MNFCQCAKKVFPTWDAEYRGTTVVVHAADSWKAKVVAAVELGVPKSREKHIRVKKRRVK